jgi:hypothetical protein
MKEISSRIILVGLLLNAGCHPSGTTRTVQNKVNIEVAGTPDCLAEVVKQTTERGIGVPVWPKWSAGLGAMEIGPVEASQYGEVAKSLKSLGCVKAVRPRPCATPNSDLKVC